MWKEVFANGSCLYSCVSSNPSMNFPNFVSSACTSLLLSRAAQLDFLNSLSRIWLSAYSLQCVQWTIMKTCDKIETASLNLTWIPQHDASVYLLSAMPSVNISLILPNRQVWPAYYHTFWIIHRPDEVHQSVCSVLKRRRKTEFRQQCKSKFNHISRLYAKIKYQLTNS